MEPSVSTVLYVLLVGLWLTVRLVVLKLIGLVSVGLLFAFIGAMYLYASVVIHLTALFERARQSG